MRTAVYPIVLILVALGVWWIVKPEPEADGCAANTPDGTPGVDKEAGIITLGTSQPFTGRAAVAGEGL